MRLLWLVLFKGCLINQAMMGKLQQIFITTFFSIFLGTLFLIPKTSEAAFSTTKKLNGCEFTAYITNTSGKKITSIGPNTSYYLVVEWLPGLGDNQACDNFDGAEIGWYSPGLIYSISPQYCNESAKLVGNKKQVKVSFKTAQDTVIRKYIIPQNGTIVCTEDEKRNEYADKLIQINGAIGSGGGGGGDTPPGDTPPGDTEPPTPLPPVDTSVNVTGVKNFDEVLGTLFNPLEDDFTSPGQIIVGFINIALLLAGILAVIFIIIGGFLMVTSAGNEGRIKQGKQTLIWAVAGLILTLLSFSIVAIVQSIIT